MLPLLFHAGLPTNQAGFVSKTPQTFLFGKEVKVVAEKFSCR